MYIYDLVLTYLLGDPVYPPGPQNPPPPMQGSSPYPGVTYDSQGQEVKVVPP